MTTLNLNKRHCHIPNSLSTNTEKHGDEHVDVLDLSVDGLTLKRNELEALLGAGAHDALFEKDDGGYLTPRFPILKPLALSATFENATVELWLGMDDQHVEWIECKVKSITLTPEPGGFVTLKCTIRAQAEEHDVAVLYRHQRTDGKIAIRRAKKAEQAKSRQNGLPLSEGEDGEGEKPEE